MVKWLKSKGPATSLKVTVLVAGSHFTYSESVAAGALGAAESATGGESTGWAATRAAADAVAVADARSPGGAVPPDGSGVRLEHPAAVPSEAAINTAREKSLPMRNVIPASRVRTTVVHAETKPALPPKYGRCSALAARVY